MTATKLPKVFIIVLNWNGREDTIECIDSLQKLRYANYTIVVVDNASMDDSVNIITNKFPDISILELKKNKGYAAGNNEGIRYALTWDADYFWILNNDTTVEPDALGPLVKKMQNNPAIGVCGSRIIYYHDRQKVQALGGGQYYRMLGISRSLGDHTPIDQKVDVVAIEKELDFIAGASVFASRQYIESTGLMNEDYFLFYEEIDWAMRGNPKFALGFARESIVYHKQGASVNAEISKGQKRSKIGDYYQIKNRLKFTHTYFPQWLPTVYLTVIYAFFKRLLKAQWGRAAMVFKLMFTYRK